MKITHKKYTFFHKNAQSNSNEYSWIGPDIKVNDKIKKSDIKQYGFPVNDNSIFWCTSTGVDEKFVILSSFMLQNEEIVKGPPRSYTDCFEWIMSCVDDEIGMKDTQLVQACIECHKIIFYRE